MPMKKLFMVHFTRVGNELKDYTGGFEAVSIEALEPKIQEFVDGVLDKEPGQVTVTVDPDNKVGQLDYGLLGNFTISVPEG